MLPSRAVASAVSLAGPLTNLALGVLRVTVVGLSGPPDGLAEGLSFLALVQVLAFVLNILPVPGLDGFGVVEPYLPAQTRQFAGSVGPYAILALFLLIIAVPAVGNALFSAGFTLLATLGGDPQEAYDGLREFLFWR